MALVLQQLADQQLLQLRAVLCSALPGAGFFAGHLPPCCTCVISSSHPTPGLEMEDTAGMLGQPQAAWQSCCGQHFCSLPSSIVWRPLATSSFSFQFSMSMANSQSNPYVGMSHPRGKQEPGPRAVTLCALALLRFLLPESLGGVEQLWGSAEGRLEPPH